MRTAHNRNGYKRGCRCEVCREASTLYHLSRRRARVMPEGDPRHGHRNTYVNYNCRCGLCAAAQAEYMRRYHAAKP